MFKNIYFLFILPLRCKPRMVLLILLAWNTTQYLYDFTISQFPHFFGAHVKFVVAAYRPLMSNTSTLIQLL